MLLYNFILANFVKLNNPLFSHISLVILSRYLLIKVKNIYKY